MGIVLNVEKSEKIWCSVRVVFFPLEKHHKYFEIHKALRDSLTLRSNLI